MCCWSRVDFLCFSKLFIPAAIMRLNHFIAINCRVCPIYDFICKYFDRSLPNYVMLFRNAGHAQAYTFPSIQYAQQPLAPAEQAAPQHQLAAPQPTLAASFPTLEGTAVLPSPESSAVPTAAVQYVPHIQYAAPQQLHLQPAVEYLAPHQLHHSHQYYPTHFTSPLDIYHSLQKHQPTSLLDSYVPSSVLLAAQRQRHTPLINRQLLHPFPAHFASLAHPTQFYHQGSHQPGYNTIAYSTAQGYSKRSPKLVTERPLKLNKRN